MGYYSDPTASKALGRINREFSRIEKLAKKLRKGLEEGTVSIEQIEMVKNQLGGIHRQVLINALNRNGEQE